MPARRQRPIARCPNTRHAKSVVHANGSYQRGAERFQRYRCQPLDEPRSHTFSLPADGSYAAYAPLPSCPRHLSGSVLRNGTYGRGTRRRQRYLCCHTCDRSCPSGCRGRHAFTPALPREHVHPAGPCAVCDERKSVHRGETAVARRHRWSTRTVVRGLEQLARGTSYAKVSRWALRSSGIVATGASTRRALPPPANEPRRRSRSAVESRRAWRIAAGWVEAFAPVVYAPIEARLRDAALAERTRLDALLAHGAPLERPQIWLLDDVPVLARQGRTKRRDGGFFLLVVGEVSWEEPGPGDDPAFAVARTGLRLVRAMAKSNTPAWRLAFDELGYAPDFIVADAGTGILAAVAAHFEPQRTRFIPSLWHVGRSIRRSLKIESAERYNEAIEAHLAHLARDGDALASPAAWVAWWDELLARVKAEGLPLDKAITQRRNYEDAVFEVLPLLLANPQIPLSSGGFETLIREEVVPVLTLRTQFANIERTNLLFDLVVARVNGAFDDHAALTRALRADAESAAGWTIALRAYDDPRPPDGVYSSLRDPTLLRSLAEARGLR